MSNRANDGIDILKSDLADREVLFGERFRFPFWLRNKTGETLCIRAVSASLQPDNGWVGPPDRMLFRSEIGLELRPSHKEVVRVSIVPPLDCLAYSNLVDVNVEYGTPADISKGHSRHAERRHLDWLLVKEVPTPAEAEVFVSFKDRENEDLAQLAVKYLRRAGLSPYLARDDQRCGCDYWEDKITPAILRSAGVLVIWSPDVVRRPDLVRREMGIARAANVPLGLFLSNDTEPPDEYPASVLEHVPFDPKAPYAAFAEGIATAAQRWKKSGRCF
jgi:hypothetical protein